MLSLAIHEGAEVDASMRTLRSSVEETSLASLNRGEHTREGCRVRGRRSEPEGTGDREVPCLGASAWSPGNPNIGRATRGRREIRWIRVRRAITIQRVAGNQETRFFQDSTKPSLVVGGRVNNITNHVVPNNSVLPAAADQCVIPPFVHDLSAEGAVGILGPNRHA